MTFDKRLKSLLVLIAGVYIFPFLYLGILSIAVKWPYPELIPASLTGKHWLQILDTQSAVTRSLLISISISLTVATVSTFGGFISSRYIAYHRNRRILMVFSYFPFMLSPVIYASFIYYYFVWSDISGSMFGVILGHLILAFPYAVIICTGFWNDYIKKMEETAETLGAGRWQTFKRVLRPLAGDIMGLCFFQTFLISWFEYGLTVILGVGKIQTLTLKVFQYVTEANYYYAALSSCLLIIPPAVILLYHRKWVAARKL